MLLRLVVASFILMAPFHLVPSAQAQSAQFLQQAPQVLPGQITPQLGQLLAQRPDMLAANIRSLAALDETIDLRPGDTVIWDTAPGQTHSVLFLPFGTGQSLNFGHVEQVLDFGENRSKLRIESNGVARTQAGTGELLRATVRDDAPGKLEEIQFWCEVHLSLGMTKRIAVVQEAPPAEYQPKTVRFRGDGVTWSVGTGAEPPPPPPGGGGMAMMCPGMQMMSGMMGGMSGMMGGMMGGGGMGMMGGGPAAGAMAGAQGTTGAGGCAGGLCALPGPAGQQQAMLGMPVAGGAGMGMMGGMPGMMGGMMGGAGMGMMGGGQGMMMQPNLPTGLTPMPQDMGSTSGDMGMGSTLRPPATPGGVQPAQ